MRIIAGAYKGRILRTVTGPGYRPAMSMVRESLFSMLDSRGVVWGGARVLDLFAGSGSLGFESLSRGAQEAVFVEKDPKASACLLKNAQTLGVQDQCRILTEDVLKTVARRPSQTFQVIFIDPPYAEDMVALTLRNLLRQGWLAEGGYLVAEVEKHLKVRDDMGADGGLVLDTDRPYGQTRILLWSKTA